MKRSLRRSTRDALALMMLLASGTAAALGLGQLEMKSKIGEPFLAEIPIVSNDPAELEQLQARVPTADTFARIGLQGPDEVVSSLRFVSAIDARGRPVIRVTSDQPINEPLLTFLVEVDWGQGRLVREYSALVAAPRAVDAPLQPAIQAPVAAPSNAIVREPMAPVTAPRPDVAESAQPVMTPAPRPAPSPEAVAVAPASPQPGQATPASSTQTRPARPGDSLSEIARDLDLGVSLEQAMVALLRANPDAFINGDINQLKRGAVLRVPQPTELSGVDAQEASALVRSQMQRFQQAQRPVVAPEPPPAPAPAIASASTAPPSASTPAPAAATRQPTPVATRPVATARPRGARLEIVPPGASRARNAGTQSGLAAGGEGAMLRQEMDQARESLAARESELSEMRSRVAELEKLQQQQQQLIALKDSQLASAQQRMAQTQTQAQAAPAEAASPWPWLAGGLVLLAFIAIAGLLARRQARTRQFTAPLGNAPARPRSIADSFGDGVMPLRTEAQVVGASGSVPSGSEREARNAGPSTAARNPASTSTGSPARKGRTRNGPSKPMEMSQPSPPLQAGALDQPPAPLDMAAPVPLADSGKDLPTGNRAPEPQQPSDRATFTQAAVPPAPTWHATTRAGVASAARTTGAAAAAVTSDAGSSGERLELARAYLALGDQASARQLLVELVVNGDATSRLQASRLLGELD